MKALWIAALASPLLAACVQTAAPPTAPTASTPAMPAASSAPLTPGNMAAYCRGEASAQYGVRPLYIKTGATKAASDGSFSIDGTADGLYDWANIDPLPLALFDAARVVAPRR